MNTNQYETVYIKSYTFIFNICKQIIDHEEDAKDITASAFLSMGERLDTIHNETAENYLVTIAKNRCYDYMRRKKVIDWNCITGIAVPFKIDYDSVVDASLLRSAISALPTNQRKVMQLRYIDDLDRKEIAKVVNIAENTVRNTIAQATKKIKKLLRHAC